MAIHVTSEIGPLKQVLLHRPGRELEHLIPDTLERLLFDDIPYLAAAQREHDVFARTLTDNGVEVLYLEDLMAGTLQNDPSLKPAFIRDFIREAGAVALNYQEELFQLLMDIQDEKELVLRTMAGVNLSELRRPAKSTLSEMVRREDRFVLEPIPNLYFTRDPFATIGRGVSLNRMYSATRRRETIYGRYILTYHPDYAQKVPLYYQPSFPFSIEVGDILNLNAQTLAIGISQRTTPEAIELLASSLFRSEGCAVNTILALDIPSMRAYMHLDTVFTQVDTDKFTIHPGILQTLRIYQLSRDGSGGVRTVERTKPLDTVLAELLELERVTLIHCGGQDRIAAEREQWNDGSNTLCIAPGKVVVYDRNNITNRILEDHGVTVLEIPSSELSRGRGGPRCMSMPLMREG